MAIWVTAGSFVVLIFLTFDTVKQITAGNYGGKLGPFHIQLWELWEGR